MTTPSFRFLIDLTMLLLFVVVLSSAAIVHFIFPPGTQAAGWLLWGLSFDQWNLILGASIAVFTLNLLLHLILQWNWVCNFLTSRLARRRGNERHTPLPDGVKTIYGVTLLITVLTLIGAFLAAAQFMVRAPAGQDTAHSLQNAKRITP